MESKVKTLIDLKKAYEKAVKNGDETFLIDGFKFVTGYVGSALEFIKAKNVWSVDAPIQSVFRYMTPFRDDIRPLNK